MSFALDRGTPDLKEAVELAAREGIVLLCSTADEGANKTNVWPAAYAPHTLTVAACNDEGEKSASSTADANYYFRGENVLYEAPGDSVPREMISGSSVATAIAAGVASLSLACCQLDGKPAELLKRAEKVKELFNKSKDNKYVRPWVLFGEAEKGDEEDMFRRIKSADR